MIDRWIAEATECDFKVALEVKKPKSWLKSVSAFANGIGGTLFFGIDNDRNIIGLADAQTDAETIRRLIKERITPYPNFILAPERENSKDILVLSVSAGRSTPYYYKADGITEAYIRIGNESVIAPSYVLNQLLLKGMNVPMMRWTLSTISKTMPFPSCVNATRLGRATAWRKSCLIPLECGMTTAS